MMISFCNQLNENHYSCPCPGERSLSRASPTPRVGFCLFDWLTCHRFRLWRSSLRPHSRVKVNERSAGPRQMSCVENNILLVADGLSVARETTATVTDISPHSGFDAASCRVSARAAGQSGTVPPASGSFHLTPSLCAEFAVVVAIFWCDTTRCSLVACSNRTAAFHLCCAAAWQSGR